MPENDAPQERPQEQRSQEQRAQEQRAQEQRSKRHRRGPQETDESSAAAGADESSAGSESVTAEGGSEPVGVLHAAVREMKSGPEDRPAQKKEKHGAEPPAQKIASHTELMRFRLRRR